MIRRKPSKTTPEVAVTFTVPAPPGEKQRVSLVGDFNDWDPQVHRMKRRKETETRSVTVRLHAGRVYRFRYVTDTGDWFDDESADRLEPNDFGGKDCVLDLTE